MCRISDPGSGKMEKYIINNELEMEVPEGFHVMTDDETDRFFGTHQNRWGVYDPDRHMMFSVGWTEKLGLKSLLVDAKSIISGYHRRLKGRLSDYKKTDRFSPEILGQNGEEIDYEYRADGTDIYQCGKMLSVKVNKRCYIIDCIRRKEGPGECAELEKGMLDSLKIE